MQRWPKRNTLFLWFVLTPLLATPLLTSSAQAGGESTPPAASATRPTKPQTEYKLAPFKAYYLARFDLGISVEGEAIRQLKAAPNQQWELSLRAKAMIASIDESSRFSLDPQQIRPQLFRYQRKVLGKKKQTQQTFDWDNNRLLSSSDKTSTVIGLDPQTLDRVSYQIQLWHDLKAGQQSMRYIIADKGRLKSHQFDRIGEEDIVTPAGTFSTIKVARHRGESSGRKTYIWFSTTLDHVIVKLEQVESNGKKYSLLLKRLETP